ncbi:MAG: hypothetical protein WAT70_06755 [Rhizobiaceae bacterium]
MALARHTDSPCTPQYFLFAVGAGGLLISFFVSLLWLTPNRGQRDVVELVEQLPMPPSGPNASGVNWRTVHR